MNITLPPSWRTVLAAEIEKPYFKELAAFVDHERQTQTVYPPEDEVFTALKLTPYDRMKAVLIGQDPYHGAGEAHGLCFSVKPGVKVPPSLKNMFKELETDLGCTIPNHGYLAPWAEQGLLMLNAVLTVRADQPASHKDKGWEKFTDAVIRAANERPEPLVFILWGGFAKKKLNLIDAEKHRVVTCGHPSPLSMKHFMGTKPFSAINRALAELGCAPINWQLPNR